MNSRNIERIILYNGGLVILRTPEGYQAPSLQGLFPDVIDKIRNLFQPNDVKWMKLENNQEIEISYEKWLELGAKMSQVKVEHKPMTASALSPFRQTPLSESSSDQSETSE